MKYTTDMVKKCNIAVVIGSSDITCYIQWIEERHGQRVDLKQIDSAIISNKYARSNRLGLVVCSAKSDHIQICIRH